MYAQAPRTRSPPAHTPCFGRLSKPTTLVPPHLNNADPGYFIVAGLVFTPLTEPYLQVGGVLLGGEGGNSVFLAFEPTWLGAVGRTALFLPAVRVVLTGFLFGGWEKVGCHLKPSTLPLGRLLTDQPHIAQEAAHVFLAG
jgi:hypothetical protein